MHFEQISCLLHRLPDIEFILLPPQLHKHLSNIRIHIDSIHFPQLPCYF